MRLPLISHSETCIQALLQKSSIEKTSHRIHNLLQCVSNVKVFPVDLGVNLILFLLDDSVQCKVASVRGLLLNNNKNIP